MIILTRGASRTEGSVRFIYWDGKSDGSWQREIDGAEAVINLAGKSVDCRYTERNKKEILTSRTQSVSALARAIQSARVKPKTWIQCGSVAIYGDRGSTVLTEESTAGMGFSPEVCTAWEASFFTSEVPVRKVMLRISFALSAQYAAIEKLTTLTKWGLGGRAGSGEQYMSWIHIDDLIRIFLWALDTDHVNGIYNTTAPQPERNKDFMRLLRTKLERPWSPPIPEIFIHIGSFFLRTEPELILKGRYAVPRRLEEEGFHFNFPELDTALSDVLDTKQL